MGFKFVLLATLLVAANAGLIAGPAATSTSSVSHGSALSYATPVYNVLPPVSQYSYAATPVSQYTYAAPAAYAVPIHRAIFNEQYAPAHYQYSIQDPHTGDFRNQEVREGDAVRTSYSLVEADGSNRVVEYTADEHNGFNAVVQREPAVVQHSQDVSAPNAHYEAAPFVHYSATPVTHVGAPVAHYAAAPNSHYAVGPVSHYASAPIPQNAATSSVSYSS